MKKNLFLVALMAVSLTMFNSCKSDEVTTVVISLDATYESGDVVTGTIAALGELKSVSLSKDGTAVTGWPITTFTTGAIIGTASTGYTIAVNNLANGTYILTATDKNDVVGSATFTVEAAVVLKTISTATTIYCTLADGSGNSTCASADGTTYSPKTATAAQQMLVDFVYFNASGTSLGIYSPSSVPALLSTTFTAWTTKNSTKFAKTTSIDYDSATYTEVKEAADAATVDNVTGLATGTLVVFKTAAGNVGIFKVNSITAGFLAVDNVNINIKVQE